MEGWSLRRGGGRPLLRPPLQGSWCVHEVTALLERLSARSNCSSFLLLYSFSLSLFLYLTDLILRASHIVLLLFLSQLPTFEMWYQWLFPRQFCVLSSVGIRSSLYEKNKTKCYIYWYNFHLLPSILFAFLLFLMGIHNVKMYIYCIFIWNAIKRHYHNLNIYISRPESLR